MAGTYYGLKIDGVVIATFTEVSLPSEGVETESVQITNAQGHTEFVTIAKKPMAPEDITFKFYAGADIADPKDKKNLEALQKWMKEGSDSAKRKNASIVEYHENQEVKSTSFQKAFLKKVDLPKGYGETGTGTIAHNGITPGA
ncbi:hypothetical protein ACFXGI_26100 [Streptomyces sp. NPDC059355]|uniref:hypothetical protein n=1 Tax=Streptomyces sp. NPDC059355 TaxID=3346811 RepID=UPI0036BCFD94